MNKYIIRNCPCFVEGIAIKGNEQKTQTCNNHKVRELTLCQDCIDCVVKRIYKLCKDDYIQFGDKELRYDTLENIIKLLDIQEVE